MSSNILVSNQARLVYFYFPTKNFELVKIAKTRKFCTHKWLYRIQFIFTFDHTDAHLKINWTRPPSNIFILSRFLQNSWVQISTIHGIPVVKILGSLFVICEPRQWYKDWREINQIIWVKYHWCWLSSLPVRVKLRRCW